MIEDRTVPLAAVTHLSPLNPRQDMASDIGKFIASIRNEGLIYPLLVRAEEGGLGVLDGGRRWRALRSLATVAAVLEDTSASMVRVQLFTGSDAQAREIALAGTTIREDLHPADEVVAFRKLTEAGVPIADIARRFDETEMHVRRRLALAGLAPELLDLWRAGAISRDIAQAFAADDATQEAQREALAVEMAMPERERWSQTRIRHALRGDAIGAGEPLAAFFFSDTARLSAYHAAGGRDDMSLFEEERRLRDGAIARKVARVILLREAERVAEEEGFGVVYSMSDDLLDPLEIEPDHTAAELEQLEHNAAEMIDCDPDRADELAAESDAITLKGLMRAVSAAERATLGVACDIAMSGGIEIIRFIPAAHPHDDPRHEETADAAPSTPPAKTRKPPAEPREPSAKPEPPAPLPPRADRETEAVLAEAATRALRAHCAGSLDFALTLAVAALGCSHGRAGVHIVMERRAPPVAPCDLLDEIAPLRFERALAVCAAAPLGDVTVAFARLMARAIDLAQPGTADPSAQRALLAAAASRGGAPGAAAPAARAALVAALDYEGLLRAMSREDILDILRREFGDAEANAAAKLTKSKIVERAALRLQKSGWLPAALTAPLGEAESAAPPDPRSTAEAMVEALAADESGKTQMRQRVERFLAACCRRGEDVGRTKASIAFEAFKVFDAAATPPTMRQFGETLAAIGVEKTRVGEGVFYLGLVMRGMEEENDDADDRED